MQTLSRLNRTHPEKHDTSVLDFANGTASIQSYYETTLLAEATDPNLLYEVQNRLAAFSVYTDSDVDGFAKVYFDRRATQDRLYSALEPLVARFSEFSEAERHDFRHQLGEYVRLYAFLSQILPFSDADLEKLYVFARHLRRLLPPDPSELPREVQQNIDMESFRLQQTGSHQHQEPRARGDPGPDDGAPRRRRRPRRQRSREHSRKRPTHVGRGRDPGDRRLELRPLQAHHGRPRLRRSHQEHAPTSTCAATARPKSSSNAANRRRSSSSRPCAGA